MTQKFKLFLIVFGLLMGAQAWSLTNYMYLNFQKMAAEASQEIQAVSSSSKCHSFWGPLLNKSTLKIHYYTGYANNLKYAVRDRYEKQALQALLLGPCSRPEMTACGFTPVGPDLFVKKVRWSSGAEKLIEFQLKDSSISEDDDHNRSNPAQALKSQAVRAQFIESARTADVLIYSGHSRFGGGPDFSPEVMTPSGEENMSYYRTQRPGLKDLLLGLQSRSTEKAFLLYLASCDSQKHFQQPLRQQHRSLKYTLLGTSEVYEQQAQKNFFKLFGILSTGLCPENFRNFFAPFQLESTEARERN